MQEARRNRAMLGTSFYAGNRGPPRTEVKRHNDVTSDQSASQVHVHLAGRNGGYGSDEQDSGYETQVLNKIFVCCLLCFGLKRVECLFLTICINFQTIPKIFEFGKSTHSAQKPYDES